MAKKSSTVKDLSGFIQVTMKNIKMALAVGDHFFVVEPVGKQYEVIARGVIRPRLKKGWITVQKDAFGIETIAEHTFFSHQEETLDEYHNNVFAALFVLIDRGNVYVKKTVKTKATYNLKPTV